MGNKGLEKPRILDEHGVIRDLSHHVDEYLWYEFIR